MLKESICEPGRTYHHMLLLHHSITPGNTKKKKNNFHTFIKIHKAKTIHYINKDDNGINEYNNDCNNSISNCHWNSNEKTSKTAVALVSGLAMS